MPYLVTMLRQDQFHAVRVSRGDGRPVMVTGWYSRPEQAVAEAKAWMERTHRQAESSQGTGPDGS